jgi:hypothetical protein
LPTDFGFYFGHWAIIKNGTFDTAWKPSGGAPDTTAPTAISNLSVTGTSATTATLSWTTTGDDAGSGTASSYDVRYFDGPCSGFDWDTAVSITGEPAPIAAGQAQGMTVTGLPFPENVYCFGMKVSDEVPNTSALSNTVTGTTLALPSGSGLPVTLDFEEGDASEFNRGCNSYSGKTWSTSSPHGGARSLRTTLTSGTNNDMACAQAFGDYVSFGGTKVTELWTVAWVKFDVGYTFPRSSQKAITINTTDGASSGGTSPPSNQKCEQVYIYADTATPGSTTARWVVDRSRYPQNADGTGCNGSSGVEFVELGSSTAAVTPGTWQKLKLHTILNTPGSANGVVQLWVDGVLAIDVSNANIRQNVGTWGAHGFGYYIVNTYTTPNDDGGGNGVQWHDDVYIGLTDPDSAPPAAPQLRAVGVVGGSVR